MIDTLAHLALRIKNDRRGVTSLEYGMIGLMIAVAIAAIVTTLGTKLSTTFDTVNTNI